MIRALADHWIFCMFVVHLVLVHSISSTSVVASQPAVAQEDAPLQIWLVSFGSVEWHAVPCVSSKAIPILGFLPLSILIQHRWFDFRVGSFFLEAEGIYSNAP
ncbi:hypothetical protein CKAN_00391100 [Cinnamomum micranthum f. kanehirae]|uniref:Secreted protein n=1 Tax=Cinnamomum micranthum f. kanehirae TaxID=337451 RepID=A0A443NAI9_9MAGN|nr:hypothetical protein CKAN_00391100 [Cinnamomum micranthum f. kanehirae]